MPRPLSNQKPAATPPKAQSGQGTCLPEQSGDGEAGATG